MPDVATRRVLVTGATGFIGGRLTERLIEAGWSVRVLVRDAAKLASSLHSCCEVMVGDVLDIEAMVRAVRDVDVIFHCAANVSTWDSWDAYYFVNVFGIQNLMIAIENENPGLSRLVHVSSVDVYGFPDLPCDERCQPTGGDFAYGETKFQGENLVRTMGEKAGISYTVIRPANVIGPGSQFIKRIGAELKSGIMLTVDGGHANAGLVYIDNLVNYLIWAASSDKAHQQCYNVRDAYDVDWATFINQFRRQIDGKGRVINLSYTLADRIAKGMEAIHRKLSPRREPMLHRLLVRFFGKTCGHSAEKIREHSGGLPELGFEEAMRRSGQWFLDANKPK